jgi:hypothetical protein
MDVINLLSCNEKAWRTHHLFCEVEKNELHDSAVENVRACKYYLRKRSPEILKLSRYF